ncbi:MAG: hypothetical protein HGB02_08640 [Chlorobiaceae bacterium]|nr:hypothetical protein [Chlorobiaceae bacterium]
MIAVKIDFDSADFYRFTEKLGPSSIEAAIKRANRKAALRVRTHLLRAIKDEGIRRKVIVHRVRLYDKSWRAGGGGGKAIKVWFGIDAVNADTIAKPIKMSKGYRVRQWAFPTAFIPKRGRYAGKLMERTTKSRLPIRRSQIEIDEAANKAFNEIATRVPGWMRELALQELRYEVFKVTGE